MRTRSRGFTLIELLVVIAIIAILAAILFPVFSKAKEKSKQTKCSSNLVQIARGIRLYGDDWGGKFPYASEWNITPNLYTCLHVTGKYVTSPSAFRCPSDQGKVAINGMPTDPYKTYWEAYKSSYNWPGTTYIGRWPHLAGLNQDNPTIPNAPIDGNQGRVWRLPPSKRIMVFDSCPFHYLKNKGVASWDQLDGLTNVVCCDGHAKSMDNRHLLYELGINDTL